jgi:uncharacterized protein
MQSVALIMVTKEHPIKIRRTRFSISEEIPGHYVRDNIFSTHFVNSLHIIFPVGEDFFVKSAKRLLPLITDPELKQQVLGFIGQEATHSREHNKFWEVLRKQGYNIDRYERFTRWFANNVAEALYFKVLPKKKAEILSLAITASLEHYTAMLGEVVFEHESNWDMLPEDMKILLKWHAAEELEHKAVAFDMLNAIDDSHQIKVMAMMLATTILFSYIGIGVVDFTLQDKEKNWKKMPADLVDFMRTIGHPSFKKFVSQWQLFFRRDFHPNDIDNLHYAEAFFATNREKFEEMKRG